MKTFLMLLSTILLMNTALYAQLDSIIFEKKNTLKYTLSNYQFRQVAPLGDQNRDGYDDFAMFNLDDTTYNVFYGGASPDTLPEFTIKTAAPHIPEGNYYIAINSVLLCTDINLDGFEDLIIIEKYGGAGPLQIKMSCYNGGPEFDTIADDSVVFDDNIPSYNRGYSLPIVLNDYTGDGYPELLFYSYEYDGVPTGQLIIINLADGLSLEPDIIIRGVLNTPPDGKKKEYKTDSFNADLTGDGKDELWLFGAYTGSTWQELTFYSEIYVGGEGADAIPEVVFHKPLIHTQTQTFFDYCEPLMLTYDVTGDGIGDIITEEVRETHDRSLLNYESGFFKGSWPVDTVMENTVHTYDSWLRSYLPVGDVNGDGYNDILATTTSSPLSRASIYLGGELLSSQPYRGYGGDAYSGWGGAIGAVGDINGDGADDFLIAKTIHMSNGGKLDGYVAIIAGDTTVGTPVSVSEEPAPIAPEGFRLHSPYPNPFNPSTTLRFELAEASTMTVTIYDLLGGQIAELVSGRHYNAGEHTLQIDAGEYNLGSGSYFIRAEAVTSSGTRLQQTAKMLYLK